MIASKVIRLFNGQFSNNILHNTGYTLIVASLLSHGAGISLQYRLLLDVAARCRNADILHLLFLHGAKSSSDLIFSTLEDSLLNYVDNEAWVPVFRVSSFLSCLPSRPNMIECLPQNLQALSI